MTDFILLLMSIRVNRRSTASDLEQSGHPYHTTLLANLLQWFWFSSSLPRIIAWRKDNRRFENWIRRSWAINISNILSSSPLFQVTQLFCHTKRNTCHSPVSVLFENITNIYQGSIIGLRNDSYQPLTFSRSNRARCF